MAKKNVPEVKSEQKVQTRYDRKMEARRQKEIKDKRDDKIFKIVSSLIGIAIVAGIVIGIAASVIKKQDALNGTYVKIGNEEVTKLEFDYYYNGVKNNYLNTYSSLLPYMGIDTSTNFEDEAYTDELTWRDMFSQMAVEQMTQTFALAADAEASGFVYDADADYESTVASIEEAATEAGVSVSEYYKSIYGEYATVKNMESFIKEGILASAYYNELLETNAPAEEEISAYYQENATDYDKVDYRSFVFTTDLAEDASEEDIETAMAELKEKADAFQAAREGGSDFEDLCTENASEDDKANYEDTESEYSLSEGRYYTGVPSAIADWLYEEGRKEGDITVIEDETNHQYYVVEFVQKYYDEADNETISDLMASDRVTEYVNALMDSYEVTDVKGKLKYLTIAADEDAADESSVDEESTESSETAE